MLHVGRRVGATPCVARDQMPLCALSLSGRRRHQGIERKHQTDDVGDTLRAPVPALVGVERRLHTPQIIDPTAPLAGITASRRAGR